MRTTISLDDRIFEAVKLRAAEKRRSVSAYIAEVLDDAVKRPDESSANRPFRLITVGGEGIHEGVDLDRPRALLVAEDVKSYGQG